MRAPGFARQRVNYPVANLRAGSVIKALKQKIKKHFLGIPDNDENQQSDRWQEKPTGHKPSNQQRDGEFKDQE